MKTLPLIANWVRVSLILMFASVYCAMLVGALAAIALISHPKVELMISMGVIVGYVLMPLLRDLIGLPQRATLSNIVILSGVKWFSDGPEPRPAIALRPTPARVPCGDSPCCACSCASAMKRGVSRVARTSSTGAVAAMRPAQERLTIAAFDAIRSAAARHLCFDIADLTPADPRSRGFFGVGAAFP
jgi:hypothetical protein